MADIPSFANNEYNRKEQEKEEILAHTKVTYKNKHAMKKHANVSWILKRLGLLALLGAAGYGVVNGAVESHQYEYVEHKNDTYNEGQIQHAHELNKRSFVQDYKIVNEEATTQDILDAIYEGQYQDYVDHNGRVRIDKDLQGEPLENDQVIEFSEQFLEQHAGKSRK